MIDKHRPRLQCIRGLFFTLTSNYTLSKDKKYKRGDKNLPSHTLAPPSGYVPNY